jgi:hypothetical protein
MEDTVGSSDTTSPDCRFDLCYPSDEALSASMQICIDHLNGTGLSLEEAWEITNLVCQCSFFTKSILITICRDVAPR